MGLSQTEQTELERWIDIIWEKAHELGLNPYPTHFEVVPQHIIYEFGSYGLPARFSHWTFGRDYHRQKTSYEYGMSKIYEIVFNTDPTQAFLVEDNSMLSHKFVCAHVLGHSDFFRRNVYFQHTDRRMIEQARLHAERIREYELEFGPREVENFLDAVLSIEEHFDPSSTVIRRKSAEQYADDRKKSLEGPQSSYDDLWNIAGKPDRPAPKPRRFPEEPEKDILRFLIENSTELAEWQRDIVEMVREEMIYFLPQMRTKIMNEGWASFWHERILESLDLTSEEHWEFRRLHSSVLSPGSRMQMNPYYVGFQILKDIKRRWDGEVDPKDPDEVDWMGRAVIRETGGGDKKLFEIIEQDNDVTFLRQYLTENLVKKLDLFTYKLTDVDGQNMWVVQDTDWRKVRDSLTDSMTNFGQPILYVDDGDYQRHGELYIRHAYDGKQLDVEYAKRTLRNLYKLWGRPVHLETMVEEKKTLLAFNGQDFKLDTAV